MLSGPIQGSFQVCYLGFEQGISLGEYSNGQIKISFNDLILVKCLDFSLDFDDDLSDYVNTLKYDSLSNLLGP